LERELLQARHIAHRFVAAFSLNRSRIPAAEVGTRIGEACGFAPSKTHPSQPVLSPNDYIDGTRGLAARLYERAQANGLPVIDCTTALLFVPGARNAALTHASVDDVGNRLPHIA